MSLKSDLRAALERERANFHMPGHKGKLKDAYSSILSLDLDTTELRLTDNLHNAAGIIADAERRVSAIYGSALCKFLVGGSSSGILAAIYAFSSAGDAILVGEDAHISVQNAANIKSLRVFKAKMSFDCGVPVCTSADSYLNILEENPDIRLCLITNPGYYGYSMPAEDIGKIADMLHKRSGVLIADEAHGAHLKFCGLGGLSALNNRADISIMSAHKTLPSLTSSAMIHISKNAAAGIKERLLASLKVFQTTSPSYLIMMSIDEGVGFMDANRKLCLNKTAEFEAFGDKIREKLNFNIRKPDDPFKLFVSAKRLGIGGFELDDMLYNEGIFTEFANETGVMLYLSVLNEAEELELFEKFIDSSVIPAGVAASIDNGAGNEDAGSVCSFAPTYSGEGSR